jgi:hypothetical protein
MEETTPLEQMQPAASEANSSMAVADISTADVFLLEEETAPSDHVPALAAASLDTGLSNAQSPETPIEMVYKLHQPPLAEVAEPEPVGQVCGTSQPPTEPVACIGQPVAAVDEGPWQPPLTQRLRTAVQRGADQDV